MSPQRPNFVLPSHVPYIEFDILVSHGLHVEANGRDCRDVGIELELVENS